LKEAEKAEAVGKLHKAYPAWLQYAPRLSKKSANHGTLEMLQHTLRENRVHTLWQKGKVISVAADEISFGSKLLCDALGRRERIYMHVDTVVLASFKGL
jgi:hypothetical protein